MHNFTLSRLAVGASAIAIATAFAVPAQAQVTGTQDAQPSTGQGDLSRPTIEPIGSNADLQWFDSDHRHFAAPFGTPCELRSPGTGAVNACSISAGA